MNRYSFLLVSLFFSTTHWLHACDCVPQGEFLYASINSVLVAEVKVVDYLTYEPGMHGDFPVSMAVEIVQIFKGKEQRSKITVWGDPGHLCREYLSNFKKGAHYVIAFGRGNPKYGLPKEKKSDYIISSCGAYYLNVDPSRGIAYGRVKRNTSAIYLNDLKTYYHADYTSMLKQEDYSDIFRQVFRNRDLVEVLHSDSLAVHTPLYLAENPVLDPLAFYGIFFEKRWLRMESEAALKQAEISSYLKITDWNCTGSIVSFRLEYVGKNTKIDFLFHQTTYSWSVESANTLEPG